VPLLGNTQALQEVSIGFASETPDELQWGDGAARMPLPELAEVGGRSDVTVEVIDSGAHVKRSGRVIPHKNAMTEPLTHTV
jgi:hypothetical protein